MKDTKTLVEEIKQEEVEEIEANAKEIINRAFGKIKSTKSLIRFYKKVLDRNQSAYDELVKKTPKEIVDEAEYDSEDG